MKFISEALANWQVERLESLIGSARARAKLNKLRGNSLVGEHLNLADEHLDDAISAMKYHKYEQASFACHHGFVQLGLAELLLQYGHKIDSGVNAVLQLSGKNEHLPEEEELAAYLASCLADMKVAIEYSNSKVSARSHGVLDRAMDYYNDSLKAIKSSEPEQAKHCAQAGLLSLLLASELIGAENQMALPGWRGLSNPMLVSPLRRSNQLVAQLAETRQRLHQKEGAAPESLSKEEADKNALLRKHWEKAFNDFGLAVNSLASGAIKHAQALLKGALREMEACLEIIGIEDPDQLQEEIDSDSGERVAVADAAGALSEVKGIVSGLKIQRKDYILSSLDKVSRLYKEALKNYERQHFERAEKSAADALLELDLIKQQIHFRKIKLTGNQPTTKHGD